MKPFLVIGLGNTLMGDDGIGWHVAGRLASDPRLPDDVEVMCGGTDLLRCAGPMEGRRRVVLIDAVQDGEQPGSVSVMGEDAGENQAHAHHLSATQAMALLRMTMPVNCTLLGISVSSARVKTELSQTLSARLPAILDRVIEELRWTSSR